MYSLRPATAADAAFVYHLHRSTMQDYVTQTWAEWNEELQARMFTHWFEPAQFQIVVVDGQDAGLISVERRPADCSCVRLRSSRSIRTVAWAAP